MDRQALRGLVFEKTGIKVDTDDPIFALVALNEAVLAETVERHVALIEAAARALAEQASSGGAERVVATPIPPAASAPYSTRADAPGISPIAAQAQGMLRMSPREQRLLGAAAGIAVLSAVLVLTGQALFSPRASALTPQQAEALHRGEKLARAVQKLDAGGRAVIAAEMQKP
jgi:hypothetical protein